MARRFTLLLTAVLLAGVPGFGQIIYPGGGYPRQRYPQGGQGPPPTSNNQARASTLTGMLRKIGDNNDNVVVESDDRTITTISISGSTKYTSAAGGSAKLGDFQPGDHVNISANQDNKNIYHAVKITMVKEGTPEEHSAASLATDDTSRPLGINTSGSKEPPAGSSPNAPANSSSAASNNGDPNRPKLRRATNSDDVIADSSSNNNSSSSSSSNNGDDRPRLRRADSNADATVANSSSNTGSSSSGAGNSSGTGNSGTGNSGTYDSDSRPKVRRAVSGADDGTPKAQITPVDPSAATVAAPAARSSAPVTPDINSDTSGRPQLRRAGDTPSILQGTVPQRMPATEDSFIDQARDAAFSFSETLPNYVVKQFTTRYQTMAARGGRTSWQVLDNVTADIIEENGNERYKNILVNGKTPLRDPEKTGSWSRGEFSSLLQDVMSPLTNADFHNKRDTTIVNRPAFRYDFSVQQPNSHWHIESEGQSYLPAYTGAIWIDKENFRALRIELSAQNLPRDFPLDTVESAVDYDYVSIGDGRYLLPTHSEALSCGRGTSGCTRNVIEFRNYKKFTADTSITFEADK